MTLLTIDATAVIISAIGGFVSIASLVITILLKGNVKELKKEVDGKMEQLLAAKKNEGKLEEKEHSESTTAALNEKLVDAVKQIPTENKAAGNPAEVKVVNETPIAVKVKEKE